MGSALIEVGGSYAWVRGTGLKTCSVRGCFVLQEFLCDYPMGKGKTCDAPLCRRHAMLQAHRMPVNLPGLFDETEEDLDERRIDFCPVHDAIAKGRRDATPRIDGGPADGQ